MRRILLELVLVVMALVTCRGLMAVASSSSPVATLPPRPTNVPNPFQPQITVRKLFKEPDFIGTELGPVAVDGRGQVYIGNMNTSIIVLSPELEELRRFQGAQPFAMAINISQSLLYVGERYEAVISLYDLKGKRQGTFWSNPDGSIEAMALAPDDTLYVIWQSSRNNQAHYLTRLDTAGKEMFSRVYLPNTSQADGIHGITFDTDGNLYVSVNGFSKGGYNIAVWKLSPNGKPLFNDVSLVQNYYVTAPGPLVRLRDGRLVICDAETAWIWQADGRLLGSTHLDMPDGSPPSTGASVRRSAITLRSDGESIYYVELRNDKTLAIDVIEFPLPLLPTSTEMPHPTFTPITSVSTPTLAHTPSLYFDIRPR